MPDPRGASRARPVAVPGVDGAVAGEIGPGLLVAAAGIGAGDIVSSTMAASAHGLQLLWVVALAAFLKGVLNEGIVRWQLGTRTTAIEGWCLHLPSWVRWYFALYLVLWTVSVLVCPPPQPPASSAAAARPPARSRFTAAAPGRRSCARARSRR